MNNARLVIDQEVHTALETGAPVVALESAVITHGLPKAPWERPLRVDWDAWRHDQPVNLETARLMHASVRESGAIPAQIAVIDGAFRIGLEDDELAALAGADAQKVSAATLGCAMALGHTAGTTVSATLVACTAVSPAIRLFATGGIGGVHRGWQRQPDFSADLSALARHPVCVVCSGAKSILDLPATLAVLDGSGVPVVGYGTDSLPRFVAQADPGITLPARVDDTEMVAATCTAHWTLGSKQAVVLANPTPEAFALDEEEVERHTIAVHAEAEERDIGGEAMTPFLLDAIARATQGRSLEANIALLSSNARLAAEVACTIASS